MLPKYNWKQFVVIPQIVEIIIPVNSQVVFKKRLCLEDNVTCDINKQKTNNLAFTTSYSR